MHYYQHNIGDFDLATRHLSRLERSIYRDLLDVYYETELPLDLDMLKLCRRIIARSNEEATAVAQVLNEFFTETPTGWYHDRCEEELDRYRNSTSQKSAAGKASAAKREQKRQRALNGSSTGVATSVEQTLNGTPTKQETINNKQKTENNKTKAQPPVAPADWIPQAAWAGYIAMRAAKKKPPTDRAIVLLVAELEKLRGTGQDVGAVLDKSTINGWTDVYPVKPEGLQRGGNAAPIDLAAAQKASTDKARQMLFGSASGREAIDA